MTRQAARGEYVHHVVDPADEIYLVAAGQLKDSIVTEEGDELVHTFYGPGMLIGEPGFFATERNRVMAETAVRTGEPVPAEQEHPAGLLRIRC